MPFRPGRGLKVMVLLPSFPLVAAALFALPLAVFAPKALAPLFALVALAALAIHVRTRRSFLPVPKRLGAALAAFLALAAGSAAWSLAPDRTLEAAVPLAGLFLGFACLLGLAHGLDDRDRARMRAALLIGLAAGLALLLIERSLDRPLLRAGLAWLGWRTNTLIFTLKPAATVAALLVWPGLLIAARRFSRAVVPAAAVAMGAIAFAGSDAAVLGLALGVPAFLLARGRPRLAGPVVGAALAGLILAAPWIPSLFPDPRVSMTGIEYLPNSGVHRIAIWQTTAARIHERPWLGHGFDTSRTLYPSSTSVVVRFAKPTIGKSEGFNAEPIPLHPHNMILQVWLELGVVGATATLAALLSILVGLERMPLEKTERAAGYGFFVTALAIAAVAYGAWQAWWLSALGLSAAFLVATFSRRPDAL